MPILRPVRASAIFVMFLLAGNGAAAEPITFTFSGREYRLFGWNALFRHSVRHYLNRRNEHRVRQLRSVARAVDQSDSGLVGIGIGEVHGQNTRV